MVKGTITLDKAAWDIIVTILLDVPKTKQKRIGVRIASFVCALLFAIVIIIGPRITGTTFTSVQFWGSVALVVAFIGVGIFVRQMQSFRLRNNHTSDIEQARTATLSYELGSKVHVESSAGSATHSWKDYSSWGENEQYLWFVGEQTGIVLLNKRNLNVDNLAEIKSRLAKAGVKKN